jgi:Transglycosylase SLT domain
MRRKALRCLAAALLALAARQGAVAQTGEGDACLPFAPHPPIVQVSATSPGGLCLAAVAAVEARYDLPRGILLAIALVETGRPDPATGRPTPWPWSVDASGQDYFFATKAEAVAWVRQAVAGGPVSIDVGCLQINLLAHPHAFANPDEAFDPAANADYAARFLLQLHAMAGNWHDAIGMYHSQTVALAVPYRQKVEVALGRAPEVSAAQTRLAALRKAWLATLPAADRPAGTVDAGAGTLHHASASRVVGATDGKLVSWKKARFCSAF